MQAKFDVSEVGFEPTPTSNMENPRIHESTLVPLAIPSELVLPRYITFSIRTDKLLLLFCGYHRIDASVSKTILSCFSARVISLLFFSSWTCIAPLFPFVVDCA